MCYSGSSEKQNSTQIKCAKILLREMPAWVKGREPGKKKKKKMDEPSDQVVLRSGASLTLSERESERKWDGSVLESCAI